MIICGGGVICSKLNHRRSDDRWICGSGDWLIKDAPFCFREKINV